MILKYDKVSASTEKAILFQFDDEEVWLPKSQILDHSSTDKVVEIEDWIVEEKGLECYQI